MATQTDIITCRFLIRSGKDFLKVKALSLEKEDLHFQRKQTKFQEKTNLFKNPCLNELHATYLRVYLVVFQGSHEDFCRCFGLTSMFDRI